jgi:putative oxidoreductase
MVTLPQIANAGKLSKFPKCSLPFQPKRQEVKDFTDLVGRILIAFLFLYEAYDSIFFFKNTVLKMESYGLTWNKEMLLYGAIFLLVMGGLMVLLGYRSSLGAFLLLLYWIPVTFIVHDFWNYTNDCVIHLAPAQGLEELVSCGKPGIEYYRRLESILFMKNLAIMGGLLMILVNGSGRYSIRRLFATTKVPGT